MSEAEIAGLVIAACFIFIIVVLAILAVNTPKRDEIDQETMARYLEDFRRDEARRKRRAQRNRDA